MTKRDLPKQEQILTSQNFNDKKIDLLLKENKIQNIQHPERTKMNQIATVLSAHIT